MNTVDGYAMSSWERGYGDFVLQPDLDTLTLVPWQEGTALVPRRRGVGGRQRRRRLPAADPAPPARPPGRARLDGLRRHRARVHRLRGHLRAGVGRGLPRPDAGQPLQRRLLAARNRARRAAAAPHPQRHVRRRHARRGLQGRVQLRPARDQLPLRPTRCAPPTSTRSTRTARRRSPPQEGMAITFMAKFDEREGTSCHIHLSLRDADGAPAVRRPARRSSTRSSPASSPRCAS